MHSEEECSRALFKDVADDFPEAVNDVWPADSPLPPLGGVIEMLNRCFSRDALDAAERDSRQTIARNHLGVTTFRRRSICRPDAGVPGLFGCGRANTDRSRR